jgi:copper chaperone CopZ
LNKLIFAARLPAVRARMEPIVARSYALLSFLLVVGCESAQPRDAFPAADPADQTPIAAPQAVLWVKGLSCPLCASGIDKQLLRVPGVQKVDVDLGTGRVAAAFAAEPRPSRSQLAKAVRDAGFTLDRIEVP